MAFWPQIEQDKDFCSLLLERNDDAKWCIIYGADESLRDGKRPEDQRGNTILSVPRPLRLANASAEHVLFSTLDFSVASTGYKENAIGVTLHRMMRISDLRRAQVQRTKERTPCRLSPPSFREQLLSSVYSTWAAPSVLFSASDPYSP